MIPGDGRWVKPSDCEDHHPDLGLDWPHQACGLLFLPREWWWGGRHALAQPSDLHLPWTTRTIRAGGVGALRGRPKSQESHTLQRRPCQPVTARPRHRAHGPASHLVAPHLPRHQNVNSSVPLFCHPLFLLSFVSLKKVEEKSFQPSSLFPETRQIL